VIFQTLDDKTECVGIYTDGNLYFDRAEFPQNLTATWAYTPHVPADDIEYASLYLEGSLIEDNIPEYLRDDWEDANKRITAFKRSLTTAQVNMNENCFFDLVPPRFLSDWCEIKNQITQHILKNLPRPKRYDFYKHVCILLADISTHKVHLDKRYLSSFSSDTKLANHAKNILNSDLLVKYNQFGTKTGRLTTKKGSLPILTMPQAFRKAIIPQNDFYVEIDFNGAEVRTLLGMLDKPQPTGDIHQFHLDNVFTTLSSRAESKEAFFAWLYGSKKTTSTKQLAQLDDYYQKDTVLKTYYKDGSVITPYGKVINNVTPHHALNYIIQSTTAELCLKQFLKVDYFLSRSQGSRVAFLIHDALVLDMKKEDINLLEGILKLMRSTNYGNFPVNIKKGKNLGDMSSWTKL